MNKQDGMKTEDYYSDLEQAQKILIEKIGENRYEEIEIELDGQWNGIVNDALNDTWHEGDTLEEWVSATMEQIKGWI
uniref:Uncharacterized protein n=1 Tax=viral metagenome TaxID=1070528 RepID=A0A6M3LM48_9ZZZZ